jgi:signal transduction histidine kinase
MPIRFRLAPVRVDVVLALGLLVLSQIEVWIFHLAGGGLAGALTIGGAAVACGWRRRFPVVVAVCVLAGGFACAGLTGDAATVTFALATMLAWYTLGTLADRRRSVGGLVFGLLIAIPMTADGSLNTYLAIVLASFVVPWLVGALWLRHLRAKDVERQREQAARDAVADERLRLARELHDVVSHNVGMIVVQAGAGDVLLDDQPEQTRASLHAIERGARDALVELRRLLGVLRADESGYGPQPGLSLLEPLVQRVRDAGIPVTSRVEGQPYRLDPALDLAAYRVIQEALTNVLAHAGPCQAWLNLHYLPDAVELEVVDDGRGPDGTSGGYGLTGIGERIALIGGELSTGPVDHRGYRVFAKLPTASP